MLRPASTPSSPPPFALTAVCLPQPLSIPLLTAQELEGSRTSPQPCPREAPGNLLTLVLSGLRPSLPQPPAAASWHQTCLCLSHPTGTLCQQPPLRHLQPMLGGSGKQAPSTPPPAALTLCPLTPPAPHRSLAASLLSLLRPFSTHAAHRSPSLGTGALWAPAAPAGPSSSSRCPPRAQGQPLPLALRLPPERQTRQSSSLLGSPSGVSFRHSQPVISPKPAPSSPWHC